MIQASMLVGLAGHLLRLAGFGSVPLPLLPHDRRAFGYTVVHTDERTIEDYRLAGLYKKAGHFGYGARLVINSDRDLRAFYK